MKCPILIPPAMKGTLNFSIPKQISACETFAAHTTPSCLKNISIRFLVASSIRNESALR